LVRIAANIATRPTAAKPSCRKSTLAMGSVAAEALTTMTTLVQTRMSAAQKRILSDRRVRAIGCRLPIPACGDSGSMKK
jgi:hypothetical protein